MLLLRANVRYSKGMKKMEIDYGRYCFMENLRILINLDHLHISSENR